MPTFEQLGLLDDERRVTPDGDVHRVVIRQSRRARQLILKVVPPYRVELVVPRGTRPKAAQAFLESNRVWIRRAHEELDARYPASQRVLPETIELKAIGRRWDVAVERAHGVKPRISARTGRLVLRIPDARPESGFELLRRWLLRCGREFLTPWLAEEAARLGLEPRRVQIRTQRTRWGSCSEHGSISLNAALLLLAPCLVRYLLVHELCHLRHLDHSPRYWKLVRQHEPEFRAHDRALAAAWAEIPLWAMPR